MTSNSASWLLIVVIALFIALPLHAQKSKEQLERERKENLRKIVETEKIILETEQEKKATLGQLTAINKQIEARQALIYSMRQEINLLNGEISDLTIVVNALQDDLKKLKEEYAAMIFAAYRANWGMQRLTYIFSAKTFNQLVRRMAYLTQYSDARKIQVEQIVLVSKTLEQQRASVQAKKSEQDKLLAEQVRQNRNLLTLKDKQSQLVSALGNKEKELKQEMAARKKSIEQLDKMIAEVIARELREKKERTVTATSSMESQKLTSLFEASRNKLQWPVETGFISSRFGQQPHPVLKNIMVDNMGIDIQTNSNALVRAVFPGTVIHILFVPGSNNAIMVQHGDYFTVYSKIKKVNVKKGQKIEAGEVIGEVYTDSQGISELQFQVWKSTTKLDPEKWLSVK